jgi:amicoumacin kinase
MLSTEITALVDSEQAEAAALLWAGKPIEKVGETENIVYRCQGTPNFALRWVHAQHRSRLQIEAELNWLHILIQAGLNVCKPLPSLNQNPIENRQIGSETFWVSAFSWIPGKAMERNQRQSWSSERVQALGFLAAQLHNQAHALPKQQYLARPNWDIETKTNIWAKLPNQAMWAKKYYQICLGQLQSLPCEKSNFGLIHGDIHTGNFLIHENQPHLFDFDDAHRGWFNQDLALILYYILGGIEKAEADFCKGLIQDLRIGYERLRNWPSDFEIQLPLFLRWRDLQLYLFLFRRWQNDAEIPKRALDARAKIETRIQAQKTWLDA